MDLWIRSQNRKKLGKVNDCKFLIQETSVNPHSHWFGIMIDGSYYAEYNSEERALEVLDEIQDLLLPDRIISIPYTNHIIKLSELSHYVYEMPKE